MLRPGGALAALAVFAVPQFDRHFRELVLERFHLVLGMGGPFDRRTFLADEPIGRTRQLVGAPPCSTLDRAAP